MIRLFKSVGPRPPLADRSDTWSSCHVERSRDMTIKRHFFAILLSFTSLFSFYEFPYG